MIRVFCSTNTCTMQAAQLCHAAQREAELRAQLAATPTTARIWHDNGVSVTALARLAGVAVTYAHCDLTTLETEYRRVEPVQAKGDRGE